MLDVQFLSSLVLQFISSLVRNEKDKDGRKCMISFYAGQKRLITYTNLRTNIFPA